MAFVGGLIPLDATVYFLLLGLSLAIAGVSLIVRTAPDGATTLGARAGVGQCYRGDWVYSRAW